MSYVSSIINKYGDMENVKSDLETLKDIQSRQGDSLLIDRIAEQAGSLSIKYKLSTLERKNLIDSLVNELTEALNERL